MMTKQIVTQTDKMVISFKQASVEDAPTLSAIGVATFLESYIEDIPGADLIKHCHRQHSTDVYERYLTGDDPRFACWIASFTATDAPVGYALTCPPDLPIVTDARDIELKRIYVFSRFHGSGAGKQLHALAEDYARALNCKRLLLGTYEENVRAIAFYKREGYIKVGERQFQVGDQLFDDIIMGKDLSS